MPNAGILTHDFPTKFKGHACVGFWLGIMSGYARLWSGNVG